MTQGGARGQNLGHLQSASDQHIWTIGSIHGWLPHDSFIQSMLQGVARGQNFGHLQIFFYLTTVTAKGWHLLCEADFRVQSQGGTRGQKLVYIRTVSTSARGICATLK